MVITIRKLMCCMLVVVLLLGGINAFAAEKQADCSITADGAVIPQLVDDNIYTYKSVGKIKIEAENALYGIYIKYDRMPVGFTVVADGVELSAHSTEYLHQYITLNGEKSVSITYDDAVSVADVYAFKTTEIPNWVQRWETLESADILICPTHSDDDQLYFAGMIPWCAANGYGVQIVYFTNHWNTHDRPHELLDGLWTCGVKYYPVISEFPDLYCKSLQEARTAFGSVGCTEDKLVDFYVKLFGRYKPLVVACHDIDGEYGHGAHMLNTTSVMSALEVSAQEGVWDVPKTYIHLWKENEVLFDWDQPLECFGGKSAFNISQEAFGCHKSQHRFSSLYNWIYGVDGAPVTKATQIRSYSPCKFGLYRSTVGMDTKINGLFENVVSYEEQRLEIERIRQAACLTAVVIQQEKLERYMPAKIYLPLARTEIETEISEPISEDIEEQNGTNKDSTTNNGIGKLKWVLLIVIPVGAILLLVINKGSRNGKN